MLCLLTAIFSACKRIKKFKSHPKGRGYLRFVVRFDIHNIKLALFCKLELRLNIIVAILESLYIKFLHATYLLHYNKKYRACFENLRRQKERGSERQSALKYVVVLVATAFNWGKYTIPLFKCKYECIIMCKKWRKRVDKKSWKRKNGIEPLEEKCYEKQNASSLWHKCHR